MDRRDFLKLAGVSGTRSLITPSSVEHDTP